MGGSIFLKYLFCFVIFFCLFAASYAVDGTGLCVSCHDTHYVDKGSCVSCHSGNSGSKRMDIAHYRIIVGKYALWHIQSDDVPKVGEKLIETARCRRCHTINQKGEKYASGLDSSIKRLIPNDIAKAILEPALNMPDFGFAAAEVDAIVNELYKYSAKDNGGSITQTVHFDVKGTSELFNKQCGGCHMALTKRGSIGAKTLAPNLSGLGGEFYYTITGRDWTRDLLSEWLKNPRNVLQTSVMPVIVLTASEQEDILSIFF